jgi:hypothetical protein
MNYRIIVKRRNERRGKIQNDELNNNGKQNAEKECWRFYVAVQVRNLFAASMHRPCLLQKKKQAKLIKGISERHYSKFFF